MISVSSAVARTPRTRPFAAAALLACAGMACAEPNRSTSLTIYSSAAPGSISPDTYRPTPGGNQFQYGYNASSLPGFAIVRDTRPVAIPDTKCEIRFTDVAAFIDPTTVQFAGLSEPSTSVLEQNFQFDLVNPSRLVDKFIDQPISVVVPRGDHTETISGVLLSSSGGGLVLKTDAGIQYINGYSSLEFPSLPQGLITRPTLVWLLRTDKPGTQTARVSYETGGLTWWADYNLTYADGNDANTGTLDVSGWVSIINQSGAGYNDASLKLIAGDVHRIERNDRRQVYEMASRAASASDQDQGFQEKSFFEYHLYTLGRPTTLPENSTKQLELFPVAHNVPCEKVLVYDAIGQWWWGGDGAYTDQNLGVQTRKDVDVYLRFHNGKEQGMGMPLPAGRIRVSKLDPADQSLEFIGEDTIRHTPKDEEVLVKLGKAFDVVGEHRQTEFSLNSARNTLTETYEVKVRNHKSESVNVIVQEHMFRWLNWEITKSSEKYEKKDTRLVHFPISLKPDQERVITYTVKYTW